MSIINEDQSTLLMFWFWIVYANKLGVELFLNFHNRSLNFQKQPYLRGWIKIGTYTLMYIFTRYIFKVAYL